MKEGGDEKAPRAKRTACKGAAKGRRATRRGKNFTIKGRKVTQDSEFGKILNSTIEDLINYVSTLKKYNKLVDGYGEEGPSEKVEGVSEDGAIKAKNLMDAESILLDSSLLYSVATNVGQECVAKFLNDKASEHCS